MELWILDNESNSRAKIGLIDTYESIIWTQRYYQPGDFELVVPATEENLNILQSGRYITRGVGEMVCRIQKVEIRTDAQNGDWMIVSGKDCRELINQRVNLAQNYFYNDWADDTIGTMFVANIMLPAQNNRTIPGLIMQRDINTRHKYGVPQGYGQLFDQISAIQQQFEYGSELILDTNETRFVFHLYEGTDRSMSQNVNPRVYFTEELDNLASSDYIENYENFKNAVYVTGEGEGTDRELVQIDVGSGTDRYELYIDGKSVSKKTDGGTLTDAEYRAALTQYGTDQLQGHNVAVTFSGVIINNTHSFGVDYFLGDLVTVYNKLGMAYDARITQVIEADDTQNGYTVIPTFEFRQATILNAKAQAVLGANGNLTFRHGAPIEVSDSYTDNLGTTTAAAVYDVPDNSASTADIPWFNDSTYRPDITSINFDDSFTIMRPKSLAYWFENLRYVASVTNTQNVKLDECTTLHRTFYNCGYSASSFSMDVSTWNTTKVTNMRQTFYSIGRGATSFSLTGFNYWKTGNVTTMYSMFGYAAYTATSPNFSYIASWDTSNVTTLAYMFTHYCYNATGSRSIADFSKFNTSKVTSMANMFRNCFRNASQVTLTGLSDWDTSKVTTMEYMFQGFGHSATKIIYNSIEGWDTSSVTNMAHMFDDAADSDANHFPGSLGGWVVRNVTTMAYMFYSYGSSQNAYALGRLDLWNTSACTDMDHMFYYCLPSASYSLNLSNWLVDNVTSHGDFNTGVTSKITAPTWAA